MLVQHLNQLASNDTLFDQNVEDGDAQIELWIPSEQVLIFRLALPKVSKRKQQEMLPWLLEDRLLSSPDDFEFFLGAPLGSASSNANEPETLVYALEKSSLRQWLQITDSASVNPSRFVPDFLALSYEEGRWSVYEEEGRLLVRTGQYEGFAVDSHFGWQQIQLLMNQQELPVRISLLGTVESDIPETLHHQIDAVQGESKRINWEFSAFPSGIDLLPSSYKPKNNNPLLAWVPAVSCFGLFVLFLLTYMVVQSWLWQRDIQVLEAGVATTYENLFSQQINSLSVDSLKNSAAVELSLLEHQYIGLQTTPLDSMVSLDSVLSNCRDCSLLMFEETEQGAALKLKDTAQTRRLLSNLEGWQANWTSPDEQGFATVNLSRSEVVN